MFSLAAASDGLFSTVRVANARGAGGSGIRLPRAPFCLTRQITMTTAAA